MHLHSPPVPEDCNFYIPVEIKEDDDIATLEGIQAALASFGFQKPAREIAMFIQESPTFTSNLQSNLYPLLYPKGRTAVYQSYRYTRPSPSPPLLTYAFQVYRECEEFRLVQVQKTG